MGLVPYESVLCYSYVIILPDCDIMEQKLMHVTSFW